MLLIYFVEETWCHNFWLVKMYKSLQTWFCMTVPCNKYCHFNLKGFSFFIQSQSAREAVIFVWLHHPSHMIRISYLHSGGRPSYFLHLHFFHTAGNTKIILILCFHVHNLITSFSFHNHILNLLHSFVSQWLH